MQEIHQKNVKLIERLSKALAKYLRMPIYIGGVTLPKYDPSIKPRRHLPKVKQQQVYANRMYDNIIDLLAKEAIKEFYSTYKQNGTLNRDYKLIKEYPGSPKLGTIISSNAILSDEYYLVISEEKYRSGNILTEWNGFRAGDLYIEQGRICQLLYITEIDGYYLGRIQHFIKTGKSSGSSTVSLMHNNLLPISEQN